MVEEEGKSEKEAQRKTHNEFVPKLRKSYRRFLANYLIRMQQVKETEMYQKLMQTAEKLMEEEDYSLEEAIKQTLKQRKFMFEELLPESNEDEAESDTEYEEESDQEEGYELDRK